jgi:hypothetical protein
LRVGRQVRNVGGFWVVSFKRGLAGGVERH